MYITGIDQGWVVDPGGDGPDPIVKKKIGPESTLKKQPDPGSGSTTLLPCPSFSLENIYPANELRYLMLSKENKDFFMIRVELPY